MKKLMSLLAMCILTGGQIISAQSAHLPEDSDGKIDLSGINLGAILKSTIHNPTIERSVVEDARNGDPDAQYRYGIYLREKALDDLSMMKLEEPEDGFDALEWFEKAAAQGHREASLEAGVLYYQSYRAAMFSNELYKRKAITYLKAGGAEEDAQFMLWLAWLAYHDDNGQQALDLCNEAIARGLPIKGEVRPPHRSVMSPHRLTLADAYEQIAFIYRFGTSDISKNEKAYFRNMELALKNCEEWSYMYKSTLLALGECHYAGIGTAIDRAKAMEIWDGLVAADASEQNHVDELIEKYSGQKNEEKRYVPVSKEDELRKLLGR